MPFVAPDYRKPNSGAVSAGIKNIENEYVTLEDEIGQKKVSKNGARESPIGLGYRVPFIVASPWSRGGYVNSEICDHTSVVQFVENFVSRKKGKKLQTPFMSDWRRAVCGDLSSVFRPYNGEKIRQPDFLDRDAFLQQIDEAKYRPMPKTMKALTTVEIEEIKSSSKLQRRFFSQEPGTKFSNALPYELYADGQLNKGRIRFSMKAGTRLFGNKSMGSPFALYAYKAYGAEGEKRMVNRNWSFAVAPGEQLDYDIPLSGFETDEYHFALFGPNGFYREWCGLGKDSPLQTSCENTVLKNGKRQIKLILTNIGSAALQVLLKDNSYGQSEITKILAGQASVSVMINLDKSEGWYDFSVLIKGKQHFLRKYAGRVENGKSSISDPAMG